MTDPVSPREALIHRLRVYAARYSRTDLDTTFTLAADALAADEARVDSLQEDVAALTESRDKNRDWMLRARAERDAALAAVERVRAVCAEGVAPYDQLWTSVVLAALDAPLDTKEAQR